MNRREKWTEDVKTTLAIQEARGDLRIKRANEYAAPTHNARMTKAYSESFPVWMVWSQWSNISISGQTKQIVKTSVTTAWGNLDAIEQSITARNEVVAWNLGDFGAQGERLEERSLNAA